MNKIIIIGAGGHAAEIRDYITHYNNAVATEKQFEVVGFLDDNENNYKAYSFNEPFLGTIKEHEVSTNVLYVMGIANVKYRRPIVSSFINKGAKFATLIHPSAIISPSATIEEGCVISHNASVGPKAVIGRFNMLNSRCTIGHDTKMGDFNFIGPQVVFSGFTQIGNDNMFGVNAATIPSIEIGNNNTIAAGMIITKPVGDEEIHFFKYKEKIVISK
uniref:acetyltransferase n=1 Tax=Flavobacterium sp. TaxID=239 RepID=UPI004049CF5D